MLDTGRFRVFRAVALRGSFSAAARDLSFSRSAVSQQVAALERAAGTALFERRPGGVALTPAGRVLLDHVDVVLARLRDAETEIGELAAGNGGRLRVGSFQTAATALMPEAVAAFKVEHPAVELSLAVLEPDEGLERVRIGELDLALVFDFRLAPDSQSRDPAIERIELLAERMSVALPADHPAASNGVTTVRELAGEPWVEGSAGFCRRLLRRAGVHEPSFGFVSDDYLLIQGLVAARVAVSFLPGLAPARPDIVVRSLDDGPTRHVEIALRVGDARPRATLRMIEILQAVAGRHRSKAAAGAA